MGYRLEAVIAAPNVLHALAGDTPEARVVALTDELSMLLMTDDYFDAVTAPGSALPGFWKAPGGFGDALAACSALGPVAYVEAEYFAGQGSQAAQVLDGGETVLGPDVDPTAGTPISQALRRLGVVRGPEGDEFDAAGLGRHRDPEDWLTAE